MMPVQKIAFDTKDILARILIEAVEEFRGMSPEEVKPLIEDDIHIRGKS